MVCPCSHEEAQRVIVRTVNGLMELNLVFIPPFGPIRRPVFFYLQIGSRTMRLQIGRVDHRLAIEELVSNQTFHHPREECPCDTTEFRQQSLLRLMKIFSLASDDHLLGSCRGSLEKTT